MRGDARSAEQRPHLPQRIASAAALGHHQLVILQVQHPIISHRHERGVQIADHRTVSRQQRLEVRCVAGIQACVDAREDPSGGARGEGHGGIRGNTS